MPIYLCLPGHASKEPWRHGMRIFDRPHNLEEPDTLDGTNISSGGERKMASHGFNMRSVSDTSHDGPASPDAAGSPTPTSKANTTSSKYRASSEHEANATSIRRARHAEILLADSIVTSHGRMWLRLRWPGAQGGFGGFVALEKTDVDELNQAGIRQTTDNVDYPTSKSMKLLDEYDDGLGGGEEGEGGEVSFVF